MNKPSICLAFICKNEEKVISRMLSSVKPFISCFVALDTGSTDETKAIIRAEMKGIPGSIFDDTWKDFATNRNLSLFLARDMKTDYILVLDCDDYLSVSDPSCFDHLDAPIYDIVLHQANIKYSRPQLFSSRINAKYVGYLHEYLETPPGLSSKTLQGVHIVFGGDGARSRDPEKYLHDAMLFEKGMSVFGEDPRSVFYYAQSLRDAGKLEQALFQYKKRAAMEGTWIEERYISLLNMGRIYSRLCPGDAETIELIHLSAFNLLPARLESLYSLAKYFQGPGNSSEAADRREPNDEKRRFYSHLVKTLERASHGLFLEDLPNDI